MRRYVLLALVIAVVAYLAFRLFAHSSALMEPAVITPSMDAHHVLAPTIDARLYRLTHERREASLPVRPRLIALTFDDGPYAVTTPLLLDVLNDLRVRATFFLIGRDAELQPELTRRIASEGFEIGNHTYTHPRLDLAPAKRVVEELVNGTRALRSFTKTKTISEEWRPPHGRYTEATITTAQRLGFTTVLWNDDPGDFRRNVTSQMLRAHIVAHGSAPEILLLHSGVLSTIEMLPSVVAEFRAKGYTFVTVSELFARTPLEEINHPERITLRPSRGG